MKKIKFPANAGFWLGILLYMETLLHILLFQGFHIAYLYTVGFTAVIALVISGLLGFMKEKASRVVTIVLVSVLSVVYCSQIVYHAVFGTMYSMSLIAMGGAAMTNFWRETLRTILENLPQLLAMLLPIAVTVVLLRKRPVLFATSSRKRRVALLLIALVLYIAIYGCLYIGGTGYYSNHYFFHSADALTDQTAQRFGLLTTMGLELFTSAESEGDDDFVPPVETTRETTAPTETWQDQEETEPTEPPVEYNVLDIDFDYLSTLTDKEKLLELNKYVSTLKPTNKNDYTGMLADYNLITICAESFATGAIHPELTPTLYKLSTEGIVFNNFYNSYPNVTTDGEYSFCMGLWPDTSRGKGASSFYATRNSYLPFTLGNVFKEQAGITPYGYHNYVGSYYGRDETHPNMGYECKFMNKGMRFTTGWPSSDLEMMQQSVGDYLASGEQFHAYYMTFSGHYKYDKENPIAKRNYNVAKDLPYSEAGKCYLSCNYELEKALAYLMEQLELAGVADKTAIVLAGDHFPYGLTSRQYSQLVGYDIDDFSKFKSTLIFWVGGLEEPIYVDEYMCNIDILPTILNLWGFDYDSRLLAGTDIFSDAEHMAVLRDQSFLTDRVWFDASSGKAIYPEGAEELSEEQLENMIRRVKNKFVLSEQILNQAYYNFVFEKGEVKIKKDSWRS